jgi:hypothetical protein
LMLEGAQVFSRKLMQEVLAPTWQEHVTTRKKANETSPIQAASYHDVP